MTADAVSAASSHRPSASSRPPDRRAGRADGARSRARCNTRSASPATAGHRHGRGRRRRSSRAEAVPWRRAHPASPARRARGSARSCPRRRDPRDRASQARTPPSPHHRRAGPADVGENRIRHGELTSRRKGLEQLHCFHRRPCRLHSSAGTPEDLGEPAQRSALGEPVAGRSIQLQHAFDRVDGVAALVRQVALVRAALEEPGALRHREVIGEPERAGVLGGRLAMRSERRRAQGRRGGESPHRIRRPGIGALRCCSCGHPGRAARGL